jgi:uncharacterized membrane protein YtjA (UPF0391 family)
MSPFHDLGGRSNAFRSSSAPSFHEELAPIWQRRNREVASMLKLALTFLVIGLIAALFGFTTIAGASIAIAKLLAFLFLALFLVFVLLGISAGNKLTGAS